MPAAERRQAGDPRPAAPARRPERAVGAVQPPAAVAHQRAARRDGVQAAVGRAAVLERRRAFHAPITHGDSRPVQPELRPAPRRAAPRARRPALHRDGDRRGRARPALRPGLGGLGPLPDRRGRPRLGAGRRGAARLARRRRQPGPAAATSTRARSASSSPTPGRSPTSRRSPSRRWRRSNACSTASSPRWGIPPAGVIAHSDLAPGRKADPGPKFDWRRLARGGRALWADGAGGAGPPPTGRPSTAAAAAAGYAGAGRRLAARARRRRLRWRPWARAPAPEAADVAALRRARLALTGGASHIKQHARGWPDGRGPQGPRKVRTPGRDGGG